MKRWNRTIREINFQNNNIIVNSFPILWLKSQNYFLPLSEVIVNKSIFEWYGKEKKDGITIKISNKLKLYLVKDYFDNCDEILNKL